MTTSPSVVKMVVTVAMEMGKMSGTIARDQVTRTSRKYVVKWMGSHRVVDQRVGLHEQGDLSSTCLLFHCPSHFVASLCIPPALPVCVSLARSLSRSLSPSLPPSLFVSLNMHPVSSLKFRQHSDLTLPSISWKTSCGSSFSP